MKPKIAAAVVGLLAGLSLGYLAFRLIAEDGETPAEMTRAAEAPAPEPGDESQDRAVSSPPGSGPEVLPAPEGGPAAAPDAPQGCPPCPLCPPPAPACPSDDQLVEDLRGDNARLRIRLEDARARLSKTGPQRRYLDPTIQGRRLLAAEERSLLLELPSWKDDAALRDELRKLPLGPDQRRALEDRYREFVRALYGELRELLVELTGDPAAGENATINSMIHDLVELSPRDLCQERMRGILDALVGGRPLSAPGQDAPACELLVLSLFAAVDALDSEIRSELGDGVAEAFWGNTSSFEFGPMGDGGGLAP